MSKASEWAKSDAASKAYWQALKFEFPAPRDGSTFSMANPIVTRYGLGVDLRLSSGGSDAFIPIEAFLALCRWGLETFGEEP